MFRSRKGAASAASQLEAHGFTVSQAGSLFRTSLSASRSEPLADANVETFLQLVIPIIEDAGGSYDGFGGDVVPRAE